MFLNLDPKLTIEQAFLQDKIERMIVNEEISLGTGAFRLSKEKYIVVETKQYQNNTVQFDFSMIRNVAPYGKLARAHIVIKDNFLKDMPV